MEKVYDGYPILFSILHMCANFQQNRTNNKYFFGGGRSPHVTVFTTKIFTLHNCFCFRFPVANVGGRTVYLHSRQHIYIYIYIYGINAYFTDANPRRYLGMPDGCTEKFDTSDHYTVVPTTPVSRRKYLYIISVPAHSPSVYF